MNGLDEAVEPGERMSRYLTAELKKANVTYEELAQRLEKQGYAGETAGSIAAKLKKGPFAATFLLVCICELGLDGREIEHILWPTQ